jgi:adenylate cyclase
MDTARQLTSRLRNSELVLLDGYWNDPRDDYGVVDAAISRLLGQDFPPTLTLAGWPAPDAPVTAPSSGGLVTILFTDIEGSTTLTRTLGDSAAQSIVRAHDEVVRSALRSSGGTEIKHTGDGIMASFPLASSAIEAAVAIQQAVAERNARPGASSFHIRVGLNAGEPVAEGADLFGTSVQLARRVCDAGEPGSIVVTDVVRQLAAGKGFLFADTGEVALKGFEDPVRLYQVRWEN